ncbi:MAG: amino acid adenylation domain-containing protein [Leptolyngbyaceae cyanobacterium]
MLSQTLEGFRLSPQQRQLWSLQNRGGIYCAQCVLKIEGGLRVEILQATLQKIVDRHEILRTYFHRQPGMKTPIQVVDSRSEFSWRALSQSDWKSQQIKELCQEERQLVSNFEQAPLLRTSLLSESANRWWLLITIPSLCADSRSLKNLVREIGDIYGIYSRNEELEDEPVQYIQFSEWQNELLEDADVDIGRAYWQQALQNTIAPPSIPFESCFGKQSEFEAEVFTLDLAPDLAAKLETISTRYKTTAANFLFACWQTLLWRITGQSEVVVNALYPSRQYEELQETIGLLAKWLPVRCSFQESFKFIEILASITDTLDSHEKWQEYFIGQDPQKTDYTPSHLPIGFEFEEWPDRYESDGVSLSLEQHSVCFERFKLKLRCVLRQESLIAEFHYDPEIIAPASIPYLAEQFQTLVASVLNNPEATVDELPILSDRQLQQLLVEFNPTQTHAPAAQCIHHRFEVQAKQTPNAVAVVFEATQLTYADLNRRANQLAHYLQALGIGPEVRIGILIERSSADEAALTLDIMTAMFGILKAGGAYLPLDTALPPASLAVRLQAAQLPILLTQQSLVDQLPDYSGRVICLDRDWELIAQASSENPTHQVDCENLAYILFTSGSTGQPKGVAIEHRSLLNYVDGILARLDLPPGSRFATVSTFAADLGHTAIFPALCTGGCLHVVSQERASDPTAFAEYFRHHPIDCLKIVPSHLATLLAAAGMQAILPRRSLILGGEAASWSLIEPIQHQAPNCQIINHYGPTETTVGVLTYSVDDLPISPLSRTVPLGRPLANTQVYVLDEKLRPVPLGVPGELYVGGAGLARGYLNRPALTAERFITNPFTHEASARLYKTGDRVRYLPDGNIEFLGRTDHQVKIRGFRIELGEIEAVLNQHPGVKQAVVTAPENEAGDRRLIGYVVPHPQPVPSVSDLRSFSLSKLPEYGVPSAFVLLKSLPLTPNGKVDRRALPAPDQTRPDLTAHYVAPRTPLEETLAAIWGRLLSLEKVGVHDDFFELGGHSLLITQLLAQVRDTFQVDISLRSLFDLPTISNLAEKIQQLQLTAPDPKASAAQKINLQAEAVLDPDIRPTGIAHNPNTLPAAIFLTGATGFLGAFLLYELLMQTQATIYCLVRSASLDSGRQKIQKSLASYLLWHESFSDRIIPVIGDLSQPLLGLSEQHFQRLASQLDVIYHNGALVNFTYPYQVLKAANVLGTQEVLRLACQVQVKPVHFISTIGAIKPKNPHTKLVREDANLDNTKISSSGYTQSKWVAEKLVVIARERGLPVCIYRPGRISGHSQTGVCNTSDHTYRMIKGCIQLGNVPNQDVRLNLSPCDYVSKAIIHLSRQPESLGKAFHLHNQRPLALSAMIQYMRSLGYPVELIPYDKWRSQLVNNKDTSGNALYPLISIFSEAEPQANASDTNPDDKITRTETPEYDCKNTLTGLAGSSIICPPVDAQLFSVYFSYLIEIGFLNAPNLEARGDFQE